MDAQMVQQAIDWVQTNVGDRVSKTELVQKVVGSGLPGEAKSALQDLPEGEHSKESIIASLKNRMMAGVGGSSRSGSGGGFGGMVGG